MTEEGTGEHLASRASRASLRLVFADAEEAARVAAALEPENADWLRVRVEGAALVAEAQADAPLSLLHTLDDALACAGAAQKAGRLGAAGRTREAGL